MSMDGIHETKTLPQKKKRKKKNAQVKTDTFLYEPHTVSVHITSPLHPTATESICLKRLSHALM